eukprot:900876-Rhodomonas_salina.1
MTDAAQGTVLGPGLETAPDLSTGSVCVVKSASPCSRQARAGLCLNGPVAKSVYGQGPDAAPYFPGGRKGC